jgi:hypothetical protein
VWHVLKQIYIYWAAAVLTDAIFLESNALDGFPAKKCIVTHKLNKLVLISK